MYLKGDYTLIFSRMQDRTKHYSKASMLPQQFDALDEPADVLVIDIDQNLDSIVKNLIKIIFNERDCNQNMDNHHRKTRLIY